MYKFIDQVEIWFNNIFFWILMEKFAATNFVIFYFAGWKMSEISLKKICFTKGIYFVCHLKEFTLHMNKFMKLLGLGQWYIFYNLLFKNTNSINNKELLTLTCYPYILALTRIVFMSYIIHMQDLI